jgi:RecA-family ATPase
MRATDSPFRLYDPPPEPEPEFVLSGKSVLDYLDIVIDKESNLLGNRWLTRDGSAFIIAPSGHGKSSWVAQVAILWSIGRIAFGIKPPHPLRILVIQSEDDDAETKKFVQMLRVFGLSPQDLLNLKNNTRFEFRRDISGEKFIKALGDFLNQFPCDIVIINPLSGFLLCDLKDDERVSVFLRQQLNAVMAAHACAPIVVHHTPKTNFTKLENMQWYDWMYAMSGCATLTNWSRAVLVVAPSKIPGTYRFIAAKRFDEIQWQHREYWFAHSKETYGKNGDSIEIIQWVPASEEQIAIAAPPAKEKQKALTTLMIWQKMSPLEVYTRETFEIWAKSQFFIGQKKSSAFLQVLIDHELVQILPESRPNTRPRITYQKASKSAIEAEQALNTTHEI